MFKAYKLALNKFNRHFLDYFYSTDSSVFTDALNYSIEEGKRIRPLILLETTKMLSKATPIRSAMNMAIALELIHNYSLVHDDLPAMDDDAYRRDRLTVHMQYREDVAILVGDALLNKAYEIMLEEITRSIDLYEMKNNALAAKAIATFAGVDGMIGGQVLDVLEASVSSQDIISMYEKKTCGLIMAATVSAAYLTGSDEKTVKDMTRLGWLIGLCFQLQDDLLDEKKDSEIGKITFIHFEGKEKTEETINTFTQEAIEILEKYENNEFLIELVKSLVNRKY